MLVLDGKSFEDMKCVYKSLCAELCSSQHPIPLIKILFDAVCVCMCVHMEIKTKIDIVRD